MNLQRLAVSLALLALTSCGTDRGQTQDRNRGSLGKADVTGSCSNDQGAALCGGKGTGTCYCDELCSGYGDCCSDYQAVCQGGGGSGGGGGPAGPVIECQAAGNICSASPAGAAVYRIYREGLRDNGVLDKDDALRMAAFLQNEASGENAKVKAFLQQVQAGGTFGPGAKELLTDFLQGTPPNYAPLENSVYQLVQGSNPTSIFDDKVRLVGEGKISGDTNLIGHSRGYAKKAEGILRFAHGSKAPAYPKVSSAAETEALRSQGPHIALDKAAAIYGLDLGQFGYRYLAEKVHYDPSAPYWAGTCQAWSYTSADNRLNALVEVEGPQGQRGVWIFGQWISRADLGNWLMAVANSLSIADSNTLDSFVTPENLLKGVTQFVMTGGRGLRADLFNDKEKGKYEVWNQPIYSADVNVAAVSDAVASAVIAHAKQNSPGYPPFPQNPKVKLVQITALWGAEVGDSHEGPVKLAKSQWNAYMITDASGVVFKGYMAHHLAAANIYGLPVTKSSSLPDYYAYAKREIIDDALDAAPSTLLAGAVDGKHFRFFVGTVLAHGVPNTMRSAFENEFFAGADSDSLKKAYPGIANAYSPEQWTQVFEPKLGSGAGFGALWGLYQP
jgi:hypothetical protein